MIIPLRQIEQLKKDIFKSHMKINELKKELDESKYRDSEE